MTKNFTEKEMACPCCGVQRMKQDFMEKLQKVRDLCGFPFKVNSAYRCSKYNEEVTKGKITMGDHIRGLACDIKIRDRYQRAEVVMQLLNSSYFLDVAVAKNYIHIGKGKAIQGLGIYV